MIQITPYYSLLNTEKPIHTIIHMLDVVKRKLECVC